MKTVFLESPAVAYRGRGWAGWTRLLGTESEGKIDDNIRSVYLALIPAFNQSVGGEPVWTGLGLEAEVTDDAGNAVEGKRIGEMSDGAREWHTLILRDALTATKGDENLWWERDLILSTLDKLGWTDQRQ